MQRSTANMIRSTPEVKRQTALQAYQAIEIAIVKVKRKHEACVQKHIARMRMRRPEVRTIPGPPRCHVAWC